MGADGVLFTAEAGGMEAPKTAVNGGYDPPESMIFYVSRNLRDEPLPQLMAAMAEGETLSLRLLAADGRSLLQDVIYTDGYESALARAGEAGGRCRDRAADRGALRAVCGRGRRVLEDRRRDGGARRVRSAPAGAAARRLFARFPDDIGGCDVRAACRSATGMRSAPAPWSFSALSAQASVKPAPVVVDRLALGLELCEPARRAPGYRAAASTSCRDARRPRGRRTPRGERRRSRDRPSRPASRCCSSRCPTTPRRPCRSHRRRPCRARRWALLIRQRGDVHGRQASGIRSAR